MMHYIEPAPPPSARISPTVAQVLGDCPGYFSQARVPWNWLCQATSAVPCKGRGGYTQ